MKSAAIYKNKKRVIIHAYSRTEKGLNIAAKPYFVLDIPVPNSEFMNAIKLALDNSEDGVVHPTNWSLFMRNHIQSMKLRSNTSLQESFLLCTVQINKDRYEIIPSINKGIVDGYVDQIEKKVEISTSEKEAVIIHEIEKAFAYCK